jgi:hypothetical protein
MPCFWQPSNRLCCYRNMEAKTPLILTLQLDYASFTFFDSLRQRYFPPDRNHLQAHLTLFHHLPPNEPGIANDLQNWSEENSPFSLPVTEVKSIGKGVAFKIECPPLVQLHKKMLERWKQWLTPQDKQKIWPHITVQNKVSVAEAQQTLRVLQAAFTPFTATGTGFCLWSYKGGPWDFIREYSFTS